ncbi:extracellular solute-binding protein [Phycicoccus endophyticus]|uniref:Extracellular solute-binding protein n=1 Tax=Phycicoccus endophyticus TaxID=1690220 RepID=A0A7G9R1I7_9MICO|nr:extracellular solute-binding protein [Phycicoccus endophyticus]NHI18751.1 extracellular solute-binding protein [Phycicoccus endophyticus]QNN49462.1 extracellular solute-binding protein [Phycicoccus endophyticus]GGL36785.1 sugar ABC transporter substrate-binding protein [Phycicoccus endophyticus]
MNTTTRRGFLGFAVASGALGVVGCSAPGSDSSGTTSTGPVSTSLPTGSLSFDMTVATGNGLYAKLVKLYEKKFPDVTVNLREEGFNSLVTNEARIASSNDPPDVLYLNAFGNLVKDGLLTSLDPYAEAYGWSEWSQSQFRTTSSTDEGVRGSGHLYGAGPGFGTTGVFYNKKLAEQVGMTTPPDTLEELESVLAAAKAKGVLPFMSDGKDARTAYPLQNLMMIYTSDPDALSSWFFGTPGTTIDTPEVLEAVQKLDEWVGKGYFPDDVNSQDSTTSMNQYMSGKGLFYVDGNWDAPALDKNNSGEFGFFPFPAKESGGVHYSMSAATLLAVPSKATAKDEAVSFLNFVQTDDDARQAALDIGGLIPAGPNDANPVSAKAGSALEGCVESFDQVLQENGLVEFMANATSSMLQSTLTPQIQLLFAGKTTPEAFIEKVQSDFESVVGS